MTSPSQLFDQAAELGLRLERRGNMLAVTPAKRCPPEFASVLRQHKRELLDLLEAKATDLPCDCAPWFHVARQVLNGEFDGADISTRDSVTIGLRRIHHPTCASALNRLWPNGLPKHLQPR